MMDSRWYLFPGQTLENTKISDRMHALHITQKGWNGITRHLDRKKLLQEAADKEAAVKRYLDEGSKNMTKSWENSLENVRKRKEEERLQLIEQKKEERQQKFLELRKEQEEIRSKYMDKVKKQIFMTTGYARALTSALVTSEVLYERQQQQGFLDRIKQHEKDEDLVYLETQKKKDEEAGKAQEEKNKLLKEKQLKHGMDLKKTIKEKELLEKTIRQAKIEKEALDNVESIKEIEKLEKMQLEEKLRKKRELREEKKKLLQQQKEREQQKIKEEKELDEVVEIYKEAKHRIECMRQDRAKELRDVVIQRREKIAAMVMAEQLDKSAAEERAIKQAMEEREAAELEKIKARMEKDEKNKQERLKDREETLAREEERKKKQLELKKWELLNRCKTDESMKKYDEARKKELWQEILKYRKILCEQMEDNKLERQREKEIEDALQKSCLQEEDTRFFDYAEEVLELAKTKGRSTFPIERVISKYVEEMNIESEKYGKKQDPCKAKSSLLLKKKYAKPPREKQRPCKCSKQ